MRCYLVIGEAAEACCQIREAESLWSGDINWSRGSQFADECPSGGTCTIFAGDPTVFGRAFWNEELPLDCKSEDSVKRNLYN